MGNLHCYFYLVISFFVYSLSLHGMEIEPFIPNKVDYTESVFDNLSHDTQKEIIEYLMPQENRQLALTLIGKNIGDNQSFNRIITPLAYAQFNNNGLILNNIEHIFASNLESLLDFQRIYKEDSPIEGFSREEPIISPIDYLATFQKFTPEKRQAIMDFLYEEKYNSPLWQDVSQYALMDHSPNECYEIIKSKINEWQLCPAAQLYDRLADYTQQLTIYSYKDIKVKQAAYGHTEMPLILALKNSQQSHSPIVFNYPIVNISDTDVQSLKKFNGRQVTLRFQQLADNAEIAPEIISLNNITLFCNTLPQSLAHLAKGDVPYSYFYDHMEICMDNNGSYSTPHYYIGQPKQYSYYYVPEPYWRLKALGKIGLFCGAWYLIAKGIKACASMAATQQHITQQAKVTAFNSEVKPLLTPDTNAALQIFAHHRHSLPNLLAQEVSILPCDAVMTPISFANAEEVITKTQNIASNYPPIDRLKDGLSWASSSAGAFTAGIHSAIAAIRIRRGPECELGESRSYSLLEKIFHIPWYIAHHVIALPASFIKREWIPYYTNPPFKIIVPKQQSPDSSD